MIIYYLLLLTGYFLIGMENTNRPMSPTIRIGSLEGCDVLDILKRQLADSVGFVRPDNQVSCNKYWQ